MIYENQEQNFGFGLRVLCNDLYCLWRHAVQRAGKNLSGTSGDLDWLDGGDLESSRLYGDYGGYDGQRCL